MAWLARLLGAAPRAEWNGLHIDPNSEHWELEGPQNFSALLRALDGWLPDASILYFEGGSPDHEIASFMAAAGVPEQAHIALGTVWPQPRVFHVPAGGQIARLAEIMEHHAGPELALHFHVYRPAEVLVQWHDVFEDPLIISSSIPEEHVIALAKRVGTPYRRALRRG